MLLLVAVVILARIARMDTLAWMVMFPGLLAASPFWPEGIHSSNFTGPVGMTLMMAVIVIGTIAFWTGVFYGVSRMFRRKGDVAS